MLVVTRNEVSLNSSIGIILMSAVSENSSPSSNNNSRFSIPLVVVNHRVRLSPFRFLSSKYQSFLSKTFKGVTVRFFVGLLKMTSTFP